MKITSVLGAILLASCSLLALPVFAQMPGTVTDTNGITKQVQPVYPVGAGGTQPGSSPSTPSYSGQYEPAYQLLGTKGGAGATTSGSAVGPVYGANYIHRIFGTGVAGCTSTFQTLDADGVTWLGALSVQYASFTGTIAGKVLTVTAVASGVLDINQTLAGTSVTSGTFIVSLGTGTGGTGTYNLNFSETVASEALTVSGATNGVTVGSSQGSATANARELLTGCTGTPAFWASLN